VSASTFRFEVRVPRWVQLEGRRLDREEFYSWIWQELARFGLAGVHEGTMLSEDAAHQGFETDSWTLDSGEAPRERDWVSSQGEETAELYFESQAGAEKAREFLRGTCALPLGAIEEQKPQDWDAQWKASFLANPDGVKIPPFWRILPPWVDSPSRGADDLVIKINPGAGFGTGTHETTQLCLQALGESARARGLSEFSALDFGSGSGILSVGLALLGARVDAVEIDPLAIDNAQENASLNGVVDRVRYVRTLEELGAPVRYPVVTANILRPVLLEFAEQLVSRLERGGVLVLSGLIEGDVREVRERYEGLLGRPCSRVLERNEWRAVVWG